MRKFIVIAAGLLLGGAMLTSSTPAKAQLGCMCGKIGSPSACVKDVITCNFKMGGVCFAPCDYSPKMARKHKKKK